MMKSLSKALALAFVAAVLCMTATGCGPEGGKPRGPVLQVK